jgi:hypothetical protein
MMLKIVLSLLPVTLRPVTFYFSWLSESFGFNSFYKFGPFWRSIHINQIKV